MYSCFTNKSYHSASYIHVQCSSSQIELESNQILDSTGCLVSTEIISQWEHSGMELTNKTITVINLPLTSIKEPELYLLY